MPWDFYLKFIGNFVQYKGGTNIMRKLFSKLMSTTLSAAMLITLGAGTVGNVASAAEDEQADVSGVTYGYTAYVGFQTDGPYAYRDPVLSSNGLTNKTYKYETQAMLPVDKAEVEATDVTSVNPVMSAEGEYTTSISGIDLVNKKNISKKGTETKATTFNMLYVTVDVPLTNKGVKLTDVTLKVDGKVVRTLKEAPNKSDARDGYQFMIADNYAPADGTDASEIFNANDKLEVLPTSSIEISYKISGGDWSKLPLAGTMGMKFSEGDFTYQVTQPASSTTEGKVQLTGLSTEGKAKSAIEVPATVNETKITNAAYKVTGLKSGAFKASSIKSADLTKAVNIKSIPSNTFNGCKNLTTVKLNSVIKSIGSSAFAGCTSLKTFATGKATASIGSKAFSGCTKLQSVTLSKATKKIGSSAFLNCKNITKLVVNQKVKVSKNAFKGCKKTIKVSGKAANKKYTVEQIKKSGYKKVK